MIILSSNYLLIVTGNNSTDFTETLPYSLTYRKDKQSNELQYLFKSLTNLFTNGSLN